MTRAVRVPWLVLTVVVVGLGVAGAALTEPTAWLLALGLGAVGGGLLHPRVPARAVARLLAGPGTRRDGRARRPETSVLAGAGGGLVLVGLFALLGAEALAFAAVWATGAYVLWRSRGDAPARPAPPHPAPTGRDGELPGDRHGVQLGVPAHQPGRTPSAAPPASASASWSTERVCRAWQTSFVQLQSARSAGDTARVAHLARERQTYLDELDRRDRAGFAAWLESGARAAGDPQRHLGDAAAARPGPLPPDRPGTAHR